MEKNENLRKKASPRRLGEVPLTNTEKSRRHQDRIASIDQELDEAFAEIDWERRNRASSSLLEFIKTYMIG